MSVLRMHGQSYTLLVMAKKLPNRSTDAVVYVYCSRDEKKILEQAAAARVKDIEGAELPVYKFVLQAALEKAGKVLGDER
jgi:uncharacterized protein (DUF1778 family)